MTLRTMATRMATAITGLTLLFAAIGCTSTTSGKAVAGEEAEAVRSGVTISDDGSGVTIGTAENAVIELFLEPQCPHCGSFIGEYGAEMNAHVDDGALTVTIRPVVFLDSESNDYSARATNAIFLIAEDDDATPDLVMGFVEGIYEELLSSMSPADDDTMAQIANDVGVSADTVNRIAASDPAIDADEVSEGNLLLMDELGVPAATPTVWDAVSESDVDIDDSFWLDDLVVK